MQAFFCFCFFNWFNKYCFCLKANPPFLQREDLCSWLQGLDWAHSCSVLWRLSLYRCQTTLATPRVWWANCRCFYHWTSFLCLSLGLPLCCPSKNLPRAALPRVPIFILCLSVCGGVDTGSCLMFWLGVDCRQLCQPRLWDEGVTRFSVSPAGVTLSLRCLPAPPPAVEFPCSHTQVL